MDTKPINLQDQLWQLMQSWIVHQGAAVSQADYAAMSQAYEQLQAILHEVTLKPVLKTTDDYLSQLVQALKILVKPDMIYLLELPHISKGQVHWVKELYLVIPSLNHLEMEKLQGLLSFLIGEHTSLHIHPIPRAAFYQGQESGNLFYMTQLQAQHLVYVKEGISPKPVQKHPQYKQWIQQAAQALVRGWQSADRFLSLAEQETDWPLCVFFIHQSIELRLRALSLAWERIEKKSHEIRLLIQVCLKYIPVLGQVFSTEPEGAMLHLLDQAYIKARYQSQFEVTQTHATQLLDKAKDIQALCEMHHQLTLGKVLEG